MEEILKGEHVIVALVVVLALHLIKDLWKDTKKQTDNEFVEMKNEMKERFRHLEGKLESFSNVLSSYVHTTTILNDKMGHVDKKLEELMHFKVETKTISKIKGEL